MVWGEGRGQVENIVRAGSVCRGGGGVSCYGARMWLVLGFRTYYLILSVFLGFRIWHWGFLIWNLGMISYGGQGAMLHTAPSCQLQHTLHPHSTCH